MISRTIAYLLVLHAYVEVTCEVMAQEVELPVLVRTFSEEENQRAAFQNGRFTPGRGETISFLGGTNTFDQQRSNALEIRLHEGWPSQELKIRNLAWQGDTIFKQARPRFFYTKTGDPQPGSSLDVRERTTPGIVFLNFGKMESLSGLSALPDFIAQYDQLLEHLQKKTKRMVLIGPTPFFKSGPAARLADSRNVVLGKYRDEIERLAEKRGLIFADAFAFPDPPEGSVFSKNGIHLTDAGHGVFADLIAKKLRFPESVKTESNSPIHQSVRRKNRLWQQFYHPTNWAFLFGDRQHVPASRDHVDTAKRWFVDEVQALPQLIAETEADIHRYALKAAK